MKRKSKNIHGKGKHFRLGRETGTYIFDLGRSMEIYMLKERGCLIVADI